MARTPPPDIDPDKFANRHWDANDHCVPRPTTTRTTATVDDDPGDEWVARRLAVKKFRAQVYGTGQRVPRQLLPNVRHGTNWGYLQGCGCQPCRDAHNTAVADWRRRNKLRLVAA